MRLLKDSEANRITPLAEARGIPLDTCPTCRSKLTYDEDCGFYDRAPGTYRFRGEEHDCDCEEQILLRKHYLLANLPEQYMRLDWADFDGSKDARDAVAMILDKWQGFKLNGMGVEFGGTGLGVGKTFAATTVAKGLIKRNVKVYFCQFRDLISFIVTGNNDAEIVERARETAVLILDEVIPPFTDRMAAVFNPAFETIIRHRTNWNLVTIMTTNLTSEELHQAYPRTYSLLEAKQLRIEMNGEDARQGKIALENIELIANDEVRPIT